MFAERCPHCGAQFGRTWHVPLQGLNIRSAGWGLDKPSLQSLKWFFARTMEPVQVLLLQIYGKEYRAGVDVFVARHVLPQNISSNQVLDIWFGSRQVARMMMFFYSLVGPLVGTYSHLTMRTL